MRELVSRPVLARALREQRTTVPLATALAALWGLVLVVVLATSDPATQRLDNSPGAITSALRLVGLDPLAAWVSIGAVHPFLIALIGVVAIARGVRAIAGELEGGTLALALARPVRRRAYLLAHAAALLPGALLLPAGYATGALIGDRAFDPPGAPLALGRMALASLQATLLVLALGLLALLVSAFASERAGPRSAAPSAARSCSTPSTSSPASGSRCGRSSTRRRSAGSSPARRSSAVRSRGTASSRSSRSRPARSAPRSRASSAATSASAPS